MCGRDQMLIAPSAVSNAESRVIPKAESQGDERDTRVRFHSFIKQQEVFCFFKKKVLKKPYTMFITIVYSLVYFIYLFIYCEAAMR